MKVSFSQETRPPACLVPAQTVVAGKFPAEV
ncbi:hypothetical protein H4W80_007598 [Nonomuraea angiospora]|uniref:Uncharacterized protein n=1 Tax=Nonomuraea angiospora TaxID=46172 RepID=A0ABR9M8V6_9ACTN|nr:hypothetical protein [Nonomuraea angiospora]